MLYIVYNNISSNPKLRFLNPKYEFKKSNGISKCLKLVGMTYKNACKLCIFPNNIIYSLHALNLSFLNDTWHYRVAFQSQIGMKGDKILPCFFCLFLLIFHRLPPTFLSLSFLHYLLTPSHSLPTPSFFQNLGLRMDFYPSIFYIHLFSRCHKSSPIVW